MTSSVDPISGVASDPIGTVRRHFNMIAVKHTAHQWLIIGFDDNEPPMLTGQRIEEIDHKWPLVCRSGHIAEEEGK